MLRLWLLCCGVMFMVAQGYEWASHQAWFGQPQLSLPWLILGGIGLAIASNRSALTALTATPPSTMAGVAATPASEPEKVAAPSLPSPPQPKAPQGKSISFEIKA